MSLSIERILGSSDEDRMYTIRTTGEEDEFVVSGWVDNSLTASYLTDALDNTQNNNNEEGYVGEFSSYNTCDFGTYVGGDGDDRINDMHLLSDGSIAFCGEASGTTGVPTRVNDVGASSVSYLGDNGMFGVINPARNAFTTFSLIGGSGNDIFNGMTLNLTEDSMFFTGYSTSLDFYLGDTSSFDPYQSERAPAGGNWWEWNNTNDIIVGVSPVTGSTSGGEWRATYLGGDHEERGLVIRTVSTGVNRYMLIFGYNDGGNLPTQNFDSGAFFSSSNQGGDDLVFAMVTKDMESLVYSTYFGGTGNDYFGATGDVRGSNHIFIEGSTNAVMGTTIHSQTHTQIPTMIGPKSGSDAVFDSEKSSGSDDSHLMLKTNFGDAIVEIVDFGDIPVSYGEALNTLDSFVYLGDTVDSELEYPSFTGSLANHDDTSGVNDDDGLLSERLFRRIDTEFEALVSVFNNSGVDALLVGYLDINGDGDFLDSNEVVFDTVGTSASNQNVTLTFNSIAYPDVVSGQSYMRIQVLRLSDAPSDYNNIVVDPSFGSGEAEGYRVLFLDTDFGDLPVGYGGTRVGFLPSTDDRAVWLGVSEPGGEVTQNFSAEADGDGVEEDGLIMPLTAYTGHFEEFKVIVGGAESGDKVYFKFWIDWNNDNVYDATHTDSGTVAVNDTVAFDMFVPLSYDSFNINVRILASDDVSKFDGASPPAAFNNGEVEDFFSTPLPLPVNLVDFNAIKEGDFVRLDWTTAQEENNSHFDVERSTDLKDWTVLGKVQGSGTVYEPITYDYLDVEPKQGINYYRLNQFDFNGAHEYSVIRSVMFSKELVSNIVVSPNPVVDVFDIYTNNGITTKADIIDQQGRTLQEVTIVNGKATVDLSSFSSGIFFVRIMNDNGFDFVKLIKL